MLLLLARMPYDLTSRIVCCRPRQVCNDDRPLGLGTAGPDFGEWSEGGSCVAAVFADFGLESRPPFTVEYIATMLGALSWKLAIQRAVDPQAVPLELPPVRGAAPADVAADLGIPAG